MRYLGPLIILTAIGARLSAAELAGVFDQESRPVLTHLTVAQVKEIASARVQDTDFPVKASDPWQVALQIQPKGNVWVAMLILPKGQISPFHIFVDDATGTAEYRAPIALRYTGSQSAR